MSPARRSRNHRTTIANTKLLESVVHPFRPTAYTEVPKGNLTPLDINRFSIRRIVNRRRLSPRLDFR